MYDGIGSDFLMVSLSMGILLLCMIAMLLTMEYIKKNRFERSKKDRNKAEIDESRLYFEEKIHELQQQLSESERRWKDSNHLIINGQQTLPPNYDLTKFDIFLQIPFFRNLGITDDSMKPDKRSIFVLTPFLEDEAKTYSIIREACNEVSLTCRRGDETYRNNDILSHIITEIINSRVIIVNINGRNPNVFYELGICHAIGKPVIIISSLTTEIPFDVIAKNIIFYKDLPSLKSQLKDELLKIFINE